jgi:hypothetical protein
MPRSNDPWLRFGAIVLPVVLVAAAARSALKPSTDTPAVNAGVPSAEEFDSLSKYLRARPAQGVPQLVSAEGVQAGLYDPFASPDFVPVEGATPSSVPQVRDRYVVTAILISRDKRVAVVDDVLVGVGTVLPGGVRVTAIESDHVEVVSPSGTRRMLTIKDSNGP